MDAPRGSAGFEESDELQHLRRRAYGPDADIAGDATAQARLSELEAAQRRERAAVDAVAGISVPAFERVPHPEPLTGSRSASRWVPQPAEKASAAREPDAGSLPDQNPDASPIADSDPTGGAPSAPRWRRRRLLPWFVAAVALLAAAITIGLSVDEPSEVVDESSEPTPVAQLSPQGPPGSASIPADDQVLGAAGLTVADFVSYGSYGPLQIWSTTKVENNRCIAVVVEEHISVFECTAPSVDTIARYNIDADLIPPGPSGELTPYIRFVLHDEVVDVYRPNTEREFYGQQSRRATTPELRL